MVSNVTSLTGIPLPVSLKGPREAEAPITDAANSAKAFTVDTSANSEQAKIVGARLELFQATGAIDLSVAAARAARPLLVDARDLAEQAADPTLSDAARGAQGVAFRDLLQQYGRSIDAAVEAGAGLLTGADLSVRADPQTDDRHLIAGADLRLPSTVKNDGAILLTANASIATADDAAAAARAGDESLRRLDAAVARFESAADGLGGHDKVLAALGTSLAAGAKPDLDAEGARLLALQVRQSLAESGQPIAGAGASGLLSHFR